MITGRARTSQGGVDKPTLSGGGSERVHVSEQTVDLLLIQHLSKAVHLGPPEFDNVSDPLIIGGKAADAQVRFLEHSLQTRALFAAGRVGLMAAAAISVISAPAGSLLRIQSKFGIGLTPLDFTGHEHECYGGPKQIGTTALKGRCRFENQSTGR